MAHLFTTERYRWNEYYIGFEGMIIDNIVSQGFFSQENQILDVGVNEDLVNLFSSAIKIAKEDKNRSTTNLAGIVFNILGTILFPLAQNKNFETNDSAQKIERAKVIMCENILKNLGDKRAGTKPGDQLFTLPQSL